MISIRFYTTFTSGTLELLDKELTPLVMETLSPMRRSVELNVDPEKHQIRVRRIDGNTVRVAVQSLGDVSTVDVDELWRRPEAIRTGIQSQCAVADSIEAFNDESNNLLSGNWLLQLFAVMPYWDAREDPAFVTLQHDTPSEKDHRWPGVVRMHCRPNFYQQGELVVVVQSVDDPEVMEITRVPLIDNQSSLLLKPRLHNGDISLDVQLVIDNAQTQMLLEAISGRPPDQPIELLGGDNASVMLRAGDRSLREYLETLAYDIMQVKYASPLLAAIVGYYFLQSNMLSRVGEWPRDLVDYYPLIPDSVVIEGWRRLMAGSIGNPPWPKWRLNHPPPSTTKNREPNACRPEDPVRDAELRFLETVAWRGAPIFYTGVHRLQDGLRWCWRRAQASAGERKKAELELLYEAVEVSNRWASAASPAGALACYRVPSLEDLFDAQRIQAVSKSLMIRSSGSDIVEIALAEAGGIGRFEGSAQFLHQYNNMVNLTRERIEEAIKGYIEPHLKMDLVSAHSIKSVSILDGNVLVELVLGFPAKGTWDDIAYEVKSRVEHLAKVSNCRVEITSEILAHFAQKPFKSIENVKNIIAVAAGMDGVGKTTAAVNLALALSVEGAKVGILDANISGPTVASQLGITGEIESKDGKTLEPMYRYDLQTMSIGFLIDDANDPLTWRGPMVTQALLQLLNDTNWIDLDYLVIDLPLGVVDIQQALVEDMPISGMILVITPHDLDLFNVRNQFKMLEELDVPVLGIVENMSIQICSNCGQEQHNLQRG